MRTTIFMVTVLMIFIQAQTVPAQWYWQNPLPNAHPLQKVSFVNENTGYASGDYGTIKRTNDGGITWLVQNSGTTAVITDISFADADHGMATFAQDSILYTNNGGVTWTARYTGTTGISMNGVAFVNPYTAFTIGSGGSILKTTDGGLNWVIQTSGTVNILNAVFFLMKITARL